MIGRDVHLPASELPEISAQTALNSASFNPKLGPERLVEIALSAANRPVISTNFRPGAIALLHMVTRQLPTIPVIWVDTGFNTPATYRYVERVHKQLDLNLKVFTPRDRAKAASSGGSLFPAPTDPDFESFVESVKLEPFRRAFEELRPDVWLTGIRRDQTEFRRSLDIVSAGPNGTHKVAPVLHWSARDVDSYIARHGLPQEYDYFDPTKPEDHLECGLQLVS